MNNEKYETALINHIYSLKDEGHSDASIRENKILYNTLANLCHDYISNVTLNSYRNRRIIFCTDIPFDSFVDEAVIKLIDNIDKVIACDNKKHMVALITVIVNRKVVDMMRAFLSEHRPTALYKKELDTGYFCDNPQNVVVLIDESQWSQIEDKSSTIEDEIISINSRIEYREDIVEILRNIHKCSVFQAVAFLSTKLLSIKANMIAKLISIYGIEEIANACFEKVCGMLDIPYEGIFDGFTDYSIPQNIDIRELANTVSKQSYVCAKRLMNAYNKGRMVRNLSRLTSYSDYIEKRERERNMLLR